MSAKLARLVERAVQSARAGRVDEAESLWAEVLGVEPGHVQALRSLGAHALQRGDTGAALQRLEAARMTAPTDLSVLMALADARRTAGDMEGEFEAIQWALAVDVRFIPALLQKGNWYESQGDAVSANATYANALESSPPEPQWPGQYRVELGRARDFIERHAQALHQYLSTETTDHLQNLDPAVAGRWREAISIHAGRTAPYVSRSSQLHVPRLPAIPFFDRSAFAFLDDLEAHTGIIRDELVAVLEQAQERFQPYIAYGPGEPVNQWQQLNHSARWSAFHLWVNGRPVKDNVERCPKTAELLNNVELCDLSGLCPSVFFSVLAPKTHIPPHTGASNAHVIAHLPLIVPANCHLHVGFEEREWQEGEVLVFDDTLQHEAINDSDEPRVVMVFDLWNPLLTQADRRMANALATVSRDFSG